MRTERSLWPGWGDVVEQGWRGLPRARPRECAARRGGLDVERVAVERDELVDVGERDVGSRWLSRVGDRVAVVVEPFDRLLDRCCFLGADAEDVVFHGDLAVALTDAGDAVGDEAVGGQECR